MIFIQEKVFENVVCEMAAILSQSVKNAGPSLCDRNWKRNYLFDYQSFQFLVLYLYVTQNLSSLSLQRAISKHLKLKSSTCLCNWMVIAAGVKWSPFLTSFEQHFWTKLHISNSSGDEKCCFSIIFKSLFHAVLKNLPLVTLFNLHCT